MDINRRKEGPSGLRMSWVVWLQAVALVCGCNTQTQRELGRFLGRPVVPAGIEYTHRRTGDQPWSIHILQIRRNPQRYSFTTTLAQDHIFGLESLPDQVAELQTGKTRPIAAVNGDFFVIRQDPYQGDPTGLHIWRGQLVSGPKGACFWLDAGGQPHIGEVEPRMRVVFSDGRDLRIGLNEFRLDDGAILYSPVLGPSTRTQGGTEYELEPADTKDLPLKIGRDFEARIAEVLPGGDHPLKDGRLILSLGPKVTGPAAQLQSGQIIQLKFDAGVDLSGVQVAIGGGPVLIEDGQVKQWKGEQPRHPRTAIGWNSEKFFLVVVDGRQKGLSIGMSIPELADLMKQLGCDQALNLDGGGSSTLWLDGEIMNSPSDGRPRRIANGLVVVESTQPETAP
jgi:exopolysaccharide biosynthesis protein